MTLTETEIQIALGTYLPEIWKQRCKLVDEGDKLWAEGDKLYAEGNKLWDEGHKLKAEGDKLIDEGDKLYAEGDKLYAEGDLLFENAVIEVYGKDTKIQWTGYGCEVEGIEYRY